MTRIEEELERLRRQGLRFLYAHINQDDAEDTIQNACIRALKFQSQYRGGNLEAWFMSIVRVSLYDFLREKGRQRNSAVSYDSQAMECLIKEILTDGESIEINLCNSSQIESILDFTCSLGIKGSMLIMYCNGMKLEDMSTLMGIPIGTVKTRILRARQAIRHRFPEGDMLL
jgi:RNA polymerase sigma-70 factor (ECF subfamily)